MPTNVLVIGGSLLNAANFRRQKIHLKESGHCNLATEILKFIEKLSYFH